MPRPALLSATLTALLAGVAAATEIERLPPPVPAPPGDGYWLDGPPPEEPVVRLAQSTEPIGRSAAGPMSRSTAIGAPQLSAPAAPRGLLQGADLSIDWLPRLEDDSLGRSTLAGSVSFGVPPLAFGMPLLVTPRAALHLVDGPSGVDAPSRLNDLGLSLGTQKKLGPCWSARGSVSVGVYGDDDSLGSNDALRVTGFGVALYQPSPEWTWAIGAAYLNRDDLAVVPAGGVIYDAGHVRYELMLPRPRVLWRLPQDANGAERGVYLAGELGGGAWAVRRADGSTDTLNLSRYGVLLGYETKTNPANPWAGTRRYELGYVFGRQLEYANTGEELSLDDSLVARVGWTY